NIQTTWILAGGASIEEFKLEVLVILVLVDHSIFRAFNKGALGMLIVEWEYNKKIHSDTQMEGIYLPDGSTIQNKPKAANTEVTAVAKTAQQSIADGKAIYGRKCFACHQSEGQGIAKVFPPLAKSDYLNKDVNRVIDAVLYGLSGEITVNGEKYNSVMTSQNLTDQEIADVLSYIYNNCDNNKTIVTPETVKSRRK